MSLEEKVNELEKTVNSLKNTAKIIYTLAVIFGLTGAFGWSIISGLKKDIDFLTQRKEELVKFFKKIEMEQEQKFLDFVESNKEQIVFDPKLYAEINAVHQRISNLKIVSKHVDTQDLRRNENIPQKHQGKDNTVMYNFVLKDNGVTVHWKEFNLSSEQ